MPCFATVAPAAAAMIPAAVDTLNMLIPSPPVPHVSMQSASHFTRTTLSRMAWAAPAISSTDSPLATSASKSVRIPASGASPAITRRKRAWDCGEFPGASPTRYPFPAAREVFKKHDPGFDWNGYVAKQGRWLSWYGKDGAPCGDYEVCYVNMKTNGVKTVWRDAPATQQISKYGFVEWVPMYPDDMWSMDDDMEDGIRLIIMAFAVGLAFLFWAQAS